MQKTIKKVKRKNISLPVILVLAAALVAWASWFIRVCAPLRATDYQIPDDAPRFPFRTLISRT
jgi:hypothetical protein